jgi:hypothetical protein
MPLGGDTSTAEVSKLLIVKFWAEPLYVNVFVATVGVAIPFGEIVIFNEKLVFDPSDQTYLLVSVKANVIV